MTTTETRPAEHHIAAPAPEPAAPLRCPACGRPIRCGDCFSPISMDEEHYQWGTGWWGECPHHTYTHADPRTCAANLARQGLRGVSVTETAQ